MPHGPFPDGPLPPPALGPEARYRARLAEGALAADLAQEHAVARLERLHHALAAWRPAPPRGDGLFASLGRRLGIGRAHAPPRAPHGLYLHGPVGRGKSMLMDLFHAGAPTEPRRRVHFHAFMLEVHQRVHDWRLAHGGPKAVGPDDALPELARRLAAEARLLCFDEFHVNDIADAMILGRLFTQLFGHGVVVVATSNFPPDRLYEGGLQRHLFLPFIRLLKERLEVVELAGPVDHRQERIRGMTVWHRPLGPAAEAALDRAFARLTDEAEPVPTEVALRGRGFTLPAARGVARTRFDDLCREARGAEDFIALARRFHTLVLDGIPRLRAEERDVARRFMLLVDALYEQRCKLIASAETAPADIYAQGREAFEFQRTVSRLAEMQAADYLAARHVN